MRNDAAGREQEPGQENVPGGMSGERRDWQRDRKRGQHTEHGQAAGDDEQGNIGRVELHRSYLWMQSVKIKQEIAPPILKIQKRVGDAGRNRHKTNVVLRGTVKTTLSNATDR